jgi:chromosome segregation ATPase
MLSTQKSLKLHNLETCLQVQRDVNADKIQQLEDTIEILIERIESLKLELNYKNQELEEIKQELVYTNHELCMLIKHPLII